MPNQKKVTAERPRERRRRARLEAILDESMAILLNEGADALTMRRLADSLDLTAGAIYRYFPGKGSILASLGHRALDRLSTAMDAAEQEALSQHGTKGEVPLIQCILARTWAYWGICIDEPATWRLLNILMVDPRQMIPEDKGHAEFMGRVISQIGRMAELLEMAAAQGIVHSEQPGVVRALGVLSSLNGSMLLVKMSEAANGSFDPASTLEGMMRSLFLGWGADSNVLSDNWISIPKN